MKKTLSLSVLFMLAICSKTFAQDDDFAYSQGSSTFSVGYGFGNIWKSLFKLSGSFSGGNYKVSAIGPVALVYEYGALEKISIGLSVGYSKVKGDYHDPSDPDFDYTETLSSISAIIRGNYHFGSSPKFDPYAGLGLGYYHFSYKYKDKQGTDNSTFSLPTALALTGQLGAKYYFSPQFGIYAELGYVGGSIAQVGVTAKF